MATQSDSNLAPPRTPLFRSMATLALLGAVFALALSVLSQLTYERTVRNEQSWIRQPLEALLDASTYDNDVLADRITVIAPDLLGSQAPATVFRARSNGAPAAAVIHTVAPDGYRGPIELLIAVSVDGTLLGVQVVRHNETPGLGDVFETRDRDWLVAFRGLSLSNPRQSLWSVRKDGGGFDALTGATITSRAIVRGVRRTLEFHRAYRDRLFAEASA